MKTILKTPSAAEVQAALDAAQAAWLNSVLLSQSARVDAKQVKRFDAAQPDAGLSALADALEQARQNFNTAIRVNCESAQKQADELAAAFILELLGTTLPADVTLPLADRGGSITREVTRLASVSDRNGALGGFFEVSDFGGRSRSTERFYCEHGQLHFAEPDLY